MDRALQKITEFKDQYAIEWIQAQLKRVQRMPGARRLFRRIASASNKEQLDDYLAEVRYALTFAGLGFQVVPGNPIRLPGKKNLIHQRSTSSFDRHCPISRNQINFSPCYPS